MRFRPIALALLLSGCSVVDSAKFDAAKFGTEKVKELTSTAPYDNTTPMARALDCLRPYMKSMGRLAVADIADGTGAIEGGTQQARSFSQRPDLMMITSLAEGGAHLVNRNSVAVAEWELKNAMDKKLGDGHPERVDNQTITYRPVKAGVILGSDYYVSGAITELNSNIDSVVAEGGLYSLQAGKRVYRVSMAVDVMVTNTRTTEIVFAHSYKKQLVGYEIGAGFFRFVSVNPLANSQTLTTAGMSNLEAFDANLGEKQNEPTQAALRWILSLASYDVLRDLSHEGAACDHFVPGRKTEDGAGLVADQSTPPTGPEPSAPPHTAAIDPVDKDRQAQTQAKANEKATARTADAAESSRRAQGGGGNQSASIAIPMSQKVKLGSISDRLPSSVAAEIRQPSSDMYPTTFASAAPVKKPARPKKPAQSFGPMSGADPILETDSFSQVQ